MFASIFVPQNGIPSCFFSAEWFRTKFREFASFFYLFLLHGTEFRAFFSSTECFGTECQEFFVPWNFAEQPEFRWNKPIVPSIPSSAD